MAVMETQGGGHEELMLLAPSPPAARRLALGGRSPEAPPAAGVGHGPPASALPPAFDAVYEEHVDFVWRSLRRLGVAEAAVPDAVQDTFIVVHRRLPSFEPTVSVRAWLFGIARNVARDHRRLVRRKGGSELPSEPPDRGPGPAEHLQRTESLRLLDAILLELDEEKREVFVMAEIEELTAPEIAVALELNVNTVYSRLRLARRAFELALSRREAGKS